MTDTENSNEPLPAASAPQVRTSAIVAFLVLALGLAWLAVLPLWLDGGLTNPIASVLIYAMMFTPALAVVLVMLVLRPIPRGQRLRFLGIWPLRPAGRVVWMMVSPLRSPRADPKPAS